MMNSNCPICFHDVVNKAKWNRNLYRCESCRLIFNELPFEVDYEDSTCFDENPKNIRKYQKYSKRDFELLRSEIKNAKCILEIGSGYGLLSRHVTKFNAEIEYFHYEKNISLRKKYLEAGHNVIESLSADIDPDLIIMAHCLEHIENAPLFIDELLDTYQNADLILFQTNPYGFIPKYIPWLWYGWSLDQHYYHFSVESLVELAARSNMGIVALKYYKLHQEFSFSIKGVVKLGLSGINMFIHNEQSDAYMLRISKK